MLTCSTTNMHLFAPSLQLLLHVCVSDADHCDICRDCRNCDGVWCPPDGKPDRIYKCNLGGLPDLNTAASYVQDSIAGYFNHLVDLGVAGVRIDAAKHIDPADLKAILAKVRFEQTVGVPRQLLSWPVCALHDYN